MWLQIFTTLLHAWCDPLFGVAFYALYDPTLLVNHVFQSVTCHFRFIHSITHDIVSYIAAVIKPFHLSYHRNLLLC